MAEDQAPGADAEFERRLSQGDFSIQRCDDTGKYFFYPREFSPYTGSGNVSWQACSGLGTVYSTTVIRRKPDQGGDYNVAIVELAEGPRMMSRVEDVPPAEVRIGMKVKARIAEREGKPLIVFDPA